jgi:hypothetical protein
MARVLTLEPQGPILISTDLHGAWDDFARLRQIFLGANDAGLAPLWISVGDWVHGPADAHDTTILDREGAPLYAYEDRSAELLRALFDLMDRIESQQVV